MEGLTSEKVFNKVLEHQLTIDLLAMKCLLFDVRHSGKLLRLYLVRSSLTINEFNPSGKHSYDFNISFLPYMSAKSYRISFLCCMFSIQY